ncbi:hypothetical protein Despr_1476 [Desulfobulbus propionicus DSM 2032]|jgi:hypothetical protein|uniref:Uncharacterized protein n=1 Tax=Desulfobulbus propionicus (strain ATCC 33891 / DSM 2032 / VKM B-1956 / 1pr3) TaxID=577650 RepID=A0A7U3YLJ7_DESPD|nr:universal stress protein [Desulfobulbus propionicus]ADW17631.1 hypothetical protein Despr_1476 [Desulfobulbus propionicus DSM 2032]
MVAIERRDPSASSPPLLDHRVEHHQDRPYILVVTRNGHLSEHVMDYALNVAHRLGYGIVTVHVDTLPFYKDSGRRCRLFAAAMEESTALFRGKAKTKKVAIEHLREEGKVGVVVSRLCHAKKRIEFVIIDKGIRLGEVAKHSPVPVFPVITTNQGQRKRTLIHPPNNKGVTAMSTTSRKRHVKNCFLFGTLTTGLYAAVFANQDVVMTYFAKGGLFAVLPVATVFAVSFFHGNFTSAFWSALGIEASRKTAAPRVEQDRPLTEPVVAPRPDTRPRLQLNA